jgi:hypothetical protein
MNRPTLLLVTNSKVFIDKKLFELKHENVSRPDWVDLMYS